MLYKQYSIEVGNKKFNYITERDELISDDEIKELCEKLALCDSLTEFSDDIDSLEDIMEIDIDSEDTDMGEDEFAYRVLSGKCQLVDSWRSFGDRFNVFANVYREYKEDVSEEPICYCFEAECGQEPDVDTIGVVDKDNPREEVFESAWRDCLYQLKRYFKVSGWLLKSGIFRITKISVDEYEYTRKERELVLA